ncbi:two-component response regulator ORR26-like [Vicia villosa]|uniref:two-component response regulator ORR26-like n=1 Tax=Vicia villosa TaxID=3911 RepID=UPI00273BA7BE|nr:two-component response regulator ORR26-like [Vicia villosa]
MCVRCKYQVTTCCNASFALNLLKETKNLYDVILIEAQMTDMDSNNFLQHVAQQIKIPIIMMSVDQSTSPSLVMKAVEKGACGYWIKPLSEGQIKNMWQHVVRKVLKENNQNDHVLKTLNAKDEKPRKIIKLMNVPGLTREQVASHLQYFKHTLDYLRVGMT